MGPQLLLSSWGLAGWDQYQDSPQYELKRGHNSSCLSLAAANHLALADTCIMNVITSYA